MWRLLTSLLPYEGLAEALVGTTLLYRLGRDFERMLGPRKYALFLLLASAAAVGARIALIASLPSSAGSAFVGGATVPHAWLRAGLASGPYHVIFGLLPLYYAYIPALQPQYFKLMGLSFSEKAGTYALAAAMAACTGPRSALAAAYSLAFGLLYALPGAGRGLQALSVPRVVANAVGSVFLPLLGEASTGGHDVVAPAAATAAAASPRVSARGPATGEDEGLLGPESLVSDAAVERLKSMGFTEADARLALQRSFGDEQGAVDRLLRAA